ncbi:MAG: hypothetical protein ACOYKM_03610, partial [Caulobacterales bacterium]
GGGINLKSIYRSTDVGFSTPCLYDKEGNPDVFAEVEGGELYRQGNDLWYFVKNGDEYIITHYELADPGGDLGTSMAVGAAIGATTLALQFAPFGSLGGPVGVGAAAFSGAFLGAATGALAGFAEHQIVEAVVD